MARGATLRQLISDLRDELRRANSPSASPDDVPSLRRTINHVYRILYLDNDWPFLNRLFDKITLNAGQRYYDFPDGLDPDRVITAHIWWSSIAEPINRGITLEDYNAYDPTANQRSSPALKWDVRFTGTKEQIEVWPLPGDESQTLQFFGTQAAPALVNDTDICLLDSDVIVLYAAAELAPADSEDKQAKLQLGKELLRLERVRANSAGGQEYRLGLGIVDRRATNPRAVVRISGG